MAARRKPLGTNAVADVVAKALTDYAPEFNALGLYFCIDVDTDYTPHSFYWTIYTEIHGWDLSDGSRVMANTDVIVGRYECDEREPEDEAAEILEWLEGKLEKYKNSRHEYTTHRPNGEK